MNALRSPRFAGRTAIVTGAGTGLGAAYARALAAEGANVAVVDLDGEGALRVAEDIVASGGNAVGQEADVADEHSVHGAVAATVERFGGVDILVNNAAVMFRFLDQPRKAFWEYTVEEWDLVMGVNVKGSWLCARAVAPTMRAAGYGKIVNVSSNMAFGTDLFLPARMAAYTTSKAAVIGLTRALAGELGPDGVNVNAVAPGATNTETVVANIPRNRMAEMARMQAVKREAHPGDIVGTVLFLSSGESDFITGQTLLVDGGFMCV